MWDEPAAKNAVEAIYEIVEKSYLLPGTNGMTHIESQTAWNQYKAAFIPCGSWLENEQLKATPTDFEMTFMPMPSLPGDKLPFAALRGGAGEPFIVPKKARTRPAAWSCCGSCSARRAPPPSPSGELADRGQGRRRPQRQAAAGHPVHRRRAEGGRGERLQPDLPAERQLSWTSTCGNASTELMAGRLQPADWLKRVKKATQKAKKNAGS